MMIVLCRSHSDIKRSEQCEHIRLNTGYQQFNHINKYYCQGGSNANDIAVENKSQADQTQNDNVPSGDRHEQTNGQRERLGENTDNLDWQNDNTQRKGNPRS